MTMLDGKESFRAIERGRALSGRWGQHGPVHLSGRASREGQVGDLVKRKRVADAQGRPHRQTSPVSFVMIACRRSVGPICDRD